MIDRVRQIAVAPLDRLTRATRISWRGFHRVLLASIAAPTVLSALAILLGNPYGGFPDLLGLERRVVAKNQRFAYPSIVRSGEYDAFYVGTSTARLLPTDVLNLGFDARFAALAMDSATAWEQLQLAGLFLRARPEPKAIIIGVDVVWCRRAPHYRRITERGFPDWLYDDDPWNDLGYALNPGALKDVLRRFGAELGLAWRPSYEPDGYGVFTPPEDEYDARRAQAHIWDAIAHPITPRTPPVTLSETERATLDFPALPDLEAFLAKVPATTRVVIAAMPVHVAAQPRPGSRLAAIETECKARIAAIAERGGAVWIDYRVASEITTSDANYWDRLHYRMPVAEALARDIAERGSRRAR